MKDNKGVYTALNKAWDAWHAQLNEGAKYIEFDVMSREVYGLRIIFDGDGYFEKREVTGVEVVDEHKYAIFLLRWL